MATRRRIVSLYFSTRLFGSTMTLRGFPNVAMENSEARPVTWTRSFTGSPSVSTSSSTGMLKVSISCSILPTTLKPSGTR